MSYFYSIEEDRRVEIKIKRSRFICSLRYVETLAHAKDFIASVSSEHKTATHNCWAYIVGDKGDLCHASDNGEPAGTAGKPMLNVLQSHNMTNISAVVTRYFGGVKLGIRGLIDAYAESVTAAVQLSGLKKIVKTIPYKIEVPYGMNDTMVYHLQGFQGKIVETQYSDIVTHYFEVEDQDQPAFNIFLEQYQNSGKLCFYTEF